MSINNFLYVAGGVLVGAVAGGAAVAYFNDDGEKIKELEEKAAAATKKAEKLRDDVIKAGEKFKEYSKLEEFVVMLVAVGFAVAHADREVVRLEETAIREFVSGVSQSALPERVKIEIEKVHQKPPTFNEAMEYVKKIENCPGYDPDIIDDIIEITMRADGIVHPMEIAFKEAWQGYKKPVRKSA